MLLEYVNQPLLAYIGLPSVISVACEQKNPLQSDPCRCFTSASQVLITVLILSNRLKKKLKSYPHPNIHHVSWRAIF